MAKDFKRRNFAFDSLQVLSGQFVMMAIGIGFVVRALVRPPLAVSVQPVRQPSSQTVVS